MGTIFPDNFIYAGAAVVVKSSTTVRDGRAVHITPV
jgi:hypothetical protein